MDAAPRHEITELTAAPGELSFVARIAGAEPQRVWFRTDSDLAPNADAALAACVMPAMRSGGTLTMDEPASPRMLRTQREFQAIQRAWSLEWEFDGPLEEVEVIAPRREVAPREPTGRVAAFFSGGVDSFSTVLSNPEVTDLIFVRGFDILPGVHPEGLADRVEARLREAADELGLPLHTVETNLRELTDPHTEWLTFFGCAVATAGLFVAPLFDRVLIAGDSDYEVQVKFGANWMVDQLWSTEQLEIVDDGGRFSRMQRVEAIAGHPVVRRTLRVCWRNPDGAYNCGNCRKCQMTMAALAAVDALEAVETFPSEIDFETFGREGILQQVTLTLWEDVLDKLRTANKPELERAVAEVVAGGKRTLGLPPDYRRRSGPPPAPAPAGTEPALFATPETARALAAADALALLVGGYDGSGNYGDICLLDAALGLLDGFSPGLLAVPVLERGYLQSWRDGREEMANPPAHAVFFGPAPDGGDGLVPLDWSAPARFGLLYLYGGGYLNPLWGERKLAMLRAAEGLLGGAPRLARLCSGLQVEPGWIAGLDTEDRAALERFELLGGRDEATTAALRELLPGSRVLDSGDDAVGILGRLPRQAAPPAADRPLEINVHLAEHDWVTGQPERVVSFVAALLDELAARAGRPLRVRPLLAFVDPRVDERPVVERLREACREQGAELAEPRLLRPATLAGLAPELERAALTLSCSFHVALTSLLLGVPAALFSDNDYYEQKAAGLLGDFGLAAAFSLRSGDDPAGAAGGIWGQLEDPELRPRLRAAADAAQARRLDAEVELLAAVGRVAIGAVAPSLEPVVPPHPAEARAAAAEARAEAAERSAAEARETLDSVLRSSSWKLTAPLRGVRGGRGRRSGR